MIHAGSAGAVAHARRHHSAGRSPASRFAFGAAVAAMRGRIDWGKHVVVVLRRKGPRAVDKSITQHKAGLDVRKKRSLQKDSHHNGFGNAVQDTSPGPHIKSKAHRAPNATQDNAIAPNDGHEMDWLRRVIAARAQAAKWPPQSESPPPQSETRKPF
jgi:hypothetical protein